ncbi:DUF4149 domain-containing protein [Actimicrobium sp. CCC2.4]|uniref:DUF4149 domain-containing protein n=1 Tax=Actimicrobium sp. CCC2.4 TaxID=3048606 RepID=UPI002AC8E061|nr:DUF4149 domain-containing protein [Actimicrobium sp. CCC2.4]MEB0133969.1 DUF4149 domain-containing protein [Actimicrobium sp. CCC2.4]WPX31506.1 DUF4149 domain-containing protein [Actimicrobium sp. CCC2.4]
MIIATRLRLLVIALWVGSLWTIGYLVAPTLFMTLADRVLAGTIAGKLFRVEAWLSVVMSLLTFGLIAWSVTTSRARTWMLRLTGMMLACTLIGYFGLQPMMAALREAASGGVFSPDARMQFGILHGVASGLYLIQSVLGIVLILKNDQVGIRA